MHRVKPCKMRRKSLTNLAKRFKSPSPTKTPIGDDKERTRKSLGDIDMIKKKSSILNADLAVKSKFEDDDLDHETQKQFRRVMRQVRKMSNSELTLLLSSDFDEALSSDEQLSIDTIVDRMPMVDRLLQEQEDLEEKVVQLASYNYSCEPKFIRGRAKLEQTLAEVQEVRQRVKAKQDRVLERLKSLQFRIESSNRILQDKSESLADEFFAPLGNPNESQVTFTRTPEEYDNFIRSYINTRKQAILKSTLANGSMESIRRMAQNLTKPSDMDSPIPAPRQRKRVSFHSQYK